MPAQDLRHLALGESPATRLSESRGTDRERLALLLQGAALLAHLERAGWHLARGFKEAGVDGGGLLRVPQARPGRPGALAQDLLRDLADRLFGEGPVAGRGVARRAVRELSGAWGQSLTPLSPEGEVERILAAAPFLWHQRYARARRALVGEHRRDGRWQTWVAATGPRRRRLLRTAAGDGELADLLAGRRARELWEGVTDQDPRSLAAAGRWREAVVLWGRHPPRSGGERLELARALYALGRFEKSSEALRSLRSAEARLLRAWCQCRLGRLRAARASVRRLASAELGPALRLDLAEVAVRVLANLGERQALGEWVERARRGARGALRDRALLLAAIAACDVGDAAAMEARLEEARGALERPELAWRWHFAASLLAGSRGAAVPAEEHLRLALGGNRRRLTRFEAGELWNEMGICRARLDDLAGAERAFRHTVRLLGGCEGPRKTTLALYNLAEIRLRRGRLLGVREILEEVTLENRLSHNLRGIVHDTELWARYELAHGRPRAALAHCRAALARLDEKGMDWRRNELRVLAARALGWLGRAEAAGQELEGAARAALGELEAEERPALLALAGDRDGALAAAAGSPLAELWQGILAGRELPVLAWGALEELEPYRAARMAFDAELLAPGSVPPAWLRRSIAALRRAGAGALAERLEVRETGPWQALASYLESDRGVATPSPEALGRLFEEAGYREVRLSWRRDPEVTGDEVDLLAGPGGDEELSAPLAGGRLILSAPAVDGVLRAFFSVLLRDPPPVAMARDRHPLGERRGGMVGECPALLQALDRLARLAPADVPVLVLGETGTGKELAAREIHRRSPRAAGPFVAVNCAALSETLLLSDLFGHVRGSFTGADRDRAGVFEAAQDGTVFLDEIADLPGSAQGMLLRVLQEGEVRRVGESLPRRVRVRVVAATHRNLAGLVAEGGFRRDLYFRLKVGCVELPPLRERGGDVLALARHFLVHQAPGAEALRLSADAERRLLAHGWPGNVRELQNVLQVAAALASDGKIEVEHLELPEEPGEVTSEAGYHQQVEAFRRKLIRRALESSRGNRAAAARRLGLSRQALSYLARQLKVV